MSEARFICRLIDSFSKNAERIAVVDQNGSRQTTYRDFYTTALRVAGYLQARRLPAHSFIPICLPTSVEYLASELGIWLSGHAVVPMSNLFPQERIDYIVAHCEAPVVIDETAVKEIAATAPTDSIIIPEEDDINALFYTSGSTGNPKGVLHSFRAFGGEVPLDRMLEEMHLKVMGVTTPFYYIASRSLFCVLFRGGTLTMVPPSVVRDIHQLESFLAEQGVEFTFLPPSLLTHFHSQSSSLKLVMTGAERLSNIYPDNFTLINHYGQTETCGAGATFVVDKPYENTPIGKPASHVEYCILDENGQEAEEGELCMKGHLTLGYYKDPERTAQLYQGGWLHTGDIVRKLSDGNLVYVNRKDWMVKINGQRVEPGEVEICLKKMDGIENAVVKGFTANTGRQYLCAYYISPAGITDEEVRHYLTSKVPDYMVPSYFVRMERFPLNINRKIDRKALLSPATDGDLIARQPYAAPQNDTERMLCEAFEQALGISHIGINDDFFALGGDSIRVMQLQTLCPTLPLSARLVYQHRTPHHIAAACAKAEPLHMERQDDYPLSQTQLGIFAASMSRQGEVAYNNGMLFRLGSGLDLPRLAKACEAVVEAHPYVKTRLFIDDKGNPRQRRNDDETYHQEIETLSDADFEVVRHELMQPFFLLADRLFRIRLFDTPSAKWLFMDFHHIIFDGYSFEVLMADLNKAYAGQTLQPESWSGFEIAQEEKMLRQTEVYQQASEWNMEEFSHLDIVSQPEADRRDIAVTYAQEEQLLDIDIEELEEACRRLGVTPNVLTTTAFGYMLGIFSHAQESLFANVYNGRKDIKAARSICMLVKTLAVHVDWQGLSTVRQLLQKVKEQLLGSMSHDLYSFAELNALNNCINSRVLFAWQGDLASTGTLGGEEYQQIPIMENATGEVLVMQLFRQDKKLRLDAEYQANAYSKAFITRMMKCYRWLLQGFMEASVEDKVLSTLPLLSAEDQAALITLGTGERLDYDQTQTFTSLFVRQAALTPDATAIVDRVDSITYAELDRKSDILATVLREAQVTADTFVGLTLPRRISFVLAALAVFKAGGAYIPLDFDYPFSRLKHMLDDSKTRILITTRNALEKKRRESEFPVEKIILLDDIDFSADSMPINESRPSSLAYMIYTSGSTGLPKGVMVEHRAMLNFLQWLLKEENLKAGEQCAIHTSFSFDGSLFDLFPPLMCGATLHILPTSLRQDLRGIYQYLVENQIVGMLLTTQLGMAMLMQYDLPLRFLMLGGEKLTHFKPSAVRLYNCYGPTEFSVCSSYHLIDQQRSYDNIPIGRPAPNTISVVVGPSGRLLPRGVAGELCLIGRQMSRGYWERKELTAEKFVSCPFMADTIMYRTGDMVRWNNEGELEYLGRIDNQVKINGYRIELGEIENKMRDYPRITDAAAVIHTSGKTQFLVGFYCADRDIVPDMLRQSLEKHLPDYMLPQQLIQLDYLPLTPNGKIDRKALMAFDTTTTGHTALVEARNSHEQIILDLARELLGTQQFGVTDDLTQLGLSSLDAIKLAALADKKGIRLKVNDILNYKTIRYIVEQGLSFGRWLNEYRPDKPIVVAIQGFSPHQVQSYFDALCDKFSVFCFASLDDYYDEMFSHQSKSDIIATYIKTLHDLLPSSADIHAFTGHCVGGELAYRCAALWQAETGQSPKVAVLNTLLRTDEEMRKMMPSKAIIEQMSPERQQQIYDWQHQHERVLKILDNVPMPAFKGKVIYFRAPEPFLAVNQLTLDSEAFTRQESIYLQRWRQLQPQMEIILISANHLTMLEPQYNDIYLKKI